MIRFIDALTLAHTKLRVHRIRTGTAVAVSGLLFGLIALIIIIAQGIFSSVDNFSNEGLNNQAVLNVSRSPLSLAFNPYDNRADASFVNEVETAYKTMVDKKKAAAAKYSITYQPELEDPSPITIDPDTKQRIVKEASFTDPVVRGVINKRATSDRKPFNINDYLNTYPSAKVIQRYAMVSPVDGQLIYMKNGKEAAAGDGATQPQSPGNDAPNLSILNKQLSGPFISTKNFDASKGEIPVILPYGTAEKLLKLQPLQNGASLKQKYDRLLEVRQRAGEATPRYCYRNQASQNLLSQAIQQKAEMKSKEADPNYTKPSVIYNVPTDTDCGAVTIASDTRSAQEKRQDANQELYQKEIGTYLGEPMQKLLVFRGVGIASDYAQGEWSVAETVKGLLGSSLGYTTWVIPRDLFEKLPATARPDVIFTDRISNGIPSNALDLFNNYDSYLVSFSDKNQARALLAKTQSQSASEGAAYAIPFGSGTLFIDELRGWFQTALLWAFAVIGSIAIIILASLVGRTVSEGRRESAIFRAIGASRLDIGAVYGTYVVLLALRIILFAAVLSIAIALTVETLYWQDATLGARLAYAASDTTREFHLFSLNSPYLLAIVGVILTVSIISSIIPILLGARRSPISDMRDDS